MSTYATDQIKRKPLPSASGPPQDIDVLDILDDYFDDRDGACDLTEKVGELSLERRPALPPRPNTIPMVPTIPPTDTITRTHTTISDAPSASKSFWKNAVDETVYFAGGLISRPVETTKHFSILRHSSAIVYYKGPSTRVVITIFSDTPLPQDRTLWLQRKGFSGNLGMNVSTMLGTSSNWIDVTPSSEALPSEMPESDERVWQRDMNKFLKKGTKHVACETCVIRIPASAADGYLRIVLCAGETRKKVLCPSPVFRIASASTDVSVLRGASLSTMPLEAGLKVASIVGTTVANRYVGPARAVVENRVQKYTSKYKPGLIAGHAEHIALAKSGLQTRFEALEQNFERARDASYDPPHPPLLSDTPPEVVGPDSGPHKPFPIKLSGTVVQGIGQSQAQLGIPTANLVGVPGDQLLRLNGIYIGWACIEPKKEGIFLEWHEAIIIIGPPPGTQPSIITKNVAAVHIIHDFDGLTFFGARLKTILMAYLRPVPQPAQIRQSAHDAETLNHDINVALASLSRQSWGVQSIRDKMKAEKAARSMADRYIETRSQVQKGIDSIPFHLAGVRTEGGADMDKAHGRGGIYIRR